MKKFFAGVIISVIFVVMLISFTNFLPSKESDDIAVVHAQNTNKDTAKIYLEYGDNFYKKGKGREALNYYNKAIELDPYLDDAYVARSVVYYVSSRTWGQKDFAIRAVDDINRALTINPKSARAYNWRGLMKSSKDPVAAIADFNKAISLNPKYLDAYESRANVYYMILKEFDKAIADYTYIINSPNIRENYMQHYDFDMMSDWAWYINLEQRLAALYNRRGNVYFDKGDEANAIADYKRAIKLSPKNMWIGRKLRDRRYLIE